MNRHLARAGLVGSLLVGLHLGSFIAAAGHQDDPIKKQQREAYRQGGLRAAAQVTGQFVIEQMYVPEGDAKSVEALSRASSLIVVGTITGQNRAWVDQSGRRLVTDYRVAANRVLKGQRPDGPLTVSIWGGRVQFADGSFAQVDTPGVIRPLRGERWVFFLHEPATFVPTVEQLGAAGGVLYEPAHMSLGMFQLQVRGREVSSMAPPGHPLKALFAKSSEAEFLKVIEASIVR